MNRKHLANLFAMGVGLSAITAAVEATTNTIVFGIEPQEIAVSECNETALSIESIHNMIAQRNNRDKKLIKSSTDKMTHL